MGPAVYLEKDSALKAMESLSEEFEIFVPKPRTEDSIKARTDQYNKEKATKPASETGQGDAPAQNGESRFLSIFNFNI